jgi:hypothetical protein
MSCYYCGEEDAPHYAKDFGGRVCKSCHPGHKELLNMTSLIRWYVDRGMLPYKELSVQINEGPKRAEA